MASVKIADFQIKQEKSYLDCVLIKKEIDDESFDNEGLKNHGPTEAKYVPDKIVEDSEEEESDSSSTDSSSTDSSSNDMKFEAFYVETKVNECLEIKMGSDEIQEENYSSATTEVANNGFEEEEIEISLESSASENITTDHDSDPLALTANIIETDIIKVMKLVKQNSSLEESRHSSEEENQCYLCQEKFGTGDALLLHISKHSNNGPYTCSVCKKTFIEKFYFDRHYRGHAYGVKRKSQIYTCDVCNKVFSQKSNLRTHYRIHTGVKPFVCKVCNKSFTGKTNLNAHLRIHSGERPFSCNLCAKAFTQKHSLDVHTRIHTGDRPYICIICGKDFIDKYRLHIHKRTHAK